MFSKVAKFRPPIATLAKLIDPMTRQRNLRKVLRSKGCGGGQVVSVRAFYSDDLCLNPSGVYNFSVKIGVEKNEN